MSETPTKWTDILVREYVPERNLTAIEIWSDIKPEMIVETVKNIPGVLNIDNMYTSKGNCIIVYFDPRWHKEEVHDAIEEALGVEQKTVPAQDDGSDTDAASWVEDAEQGPASEPAD